MLLKWCQTHISSCNLKELNSLLLEDLSFICSHGPQWSLPPYVLLSPSAPSGPAEGTITSEKGLKYTRRSRSTCKCDRLVVRSLMQCSDHSEEACGPSRAFPNSPPPRLTPFCKLSNPIFHAYHTENHEAGSKMMRL